MATSSILRWTGHICEDVPATVQQEPTKQCSGVLVICSHSGRSAAFCLCGRDDVAAAAPALRDAAAAVPLTWDSMTGSIQRIPLSLQQYC